MVKIELSDQEASELHSLVLHEQREAERYFISDGTLWEIAQQLRIAEWRKNHGR